MLPQVMFDRVLFGMRVQGGPSWRAGVRGACVYRAGSNRCAVGLLMEDQAYDPAFDSTVNSTIQELLDRAYEYSPMIARLRDALAQSGLGKETYPLLAQLQLAHDLAATKNPGGKDFLPEFEKHMRGVAHEFNLEYTPPWSQS
jgi:hypothetical protein